MKLTEVHKILGSGEYSQWSAIGGYPTYRNNLDLLVDGDMDGTQFGHHSCAVHRDDVSLTMAWGMDPPGDQNPHDPESGWTTMFPQARSIRSFQIDIFYCGSLIDRHVGASLAGDGYIPYPRSHSLSPKNDWNPSGPIGWTVTRWQVELIRIVESLELGHPSEIDSRLERSQIMLED